ncbi:hypothetical protein RV03_GL003310 [Enterococcus gallinarum]|nr:hypothetical protein RV03_GL003310 [Enterococcus gallinarum]
MTVPESCQPKRTNKQEVYGLSVFYQNFSFHEKEKSFFLSPLSIFAKKGGMQQ